MHTNSQWLTIQEAADVSSVHYSTIRRWIASGQLRAYKFGPRAIRIDPTDLQAMAEPANPITFHHVHGGDA